MRFEVLGPLRVHHDGEPVPIAGVKLQVLLTTLLLHANRTVPTGELRQALWDGEPPPSVGTALQNHVARLRRSLPAAAGDRIETTDGGYLVRVRPGELDVEEFTGFLTRAEQARRTGDWAAVERWAAGAEGLWRGTPLAGQAAAVLAPRIQALAAQHVEALEWRIEAAMRQGRLAGLAARLAGLIDEHPFNEVFTAQLMRVLLQSGRRAHALEAHARLRRRLVDELGIEPGADVRRALAEALADPEPVPRPGAGAGSAAEPDARIGMALNPEPAAGRPVPSLPPAVRVLMGRDEEVAALVAACLGPAGPGPAAVRTVDGMPGVGKSAFALHVGHRLAPHFPDGQIFLQMYGHTPGTRPLSADDALAALLTAVGVPADQIPPTPAGRAALWLAKLRGARILVLLDDVRRSEQIRPLLPDGPGPVVLVTGRRRLIGLDDAVPLTLDVLGHRPAGELFVAKAGRPGLVADDPDVREVVRLCGLLPLAVHLVAARLRHHPAWTVRDLVAELVDGRTRLAAINAEDTSVSAAFESSYLALPASEQTMFRRLGLLPGDEADAGAAAALAGTDLVGARRALEGLEDRHLVEEPVRGRYRMHDLLRDHARALAEEEPAEVSSTALDRLFEHYTSAARGADAGLQPGAPAADAAAARAWMLTELDNLLAALAVADDLARPVHVVDLSAALHEFLRGTGRLTTAAAVAERAVAAARGLGDARRLALSLLQAGVALHYADEYAPAESCFTEALTLTETDDAATRAQLLRRRGSVRRLRGDYTGGSADLAAALALSERLGDVNGQGEVRLNQAHIRQDTGRLAEADAEARASLALFRAAENRLGVANALARLGDIRQLTGDYRGAATVLGEALERYRELGNRIGEAAMLADLGLVEGRLGRNDAAAGYLRDAVALCDEIGDRTTMAYAYKCLGDVLPAEAAVLTLRKALALCRELGTRMGTAHVAVSLAAAHRLGGRRHVAALHLATAARTFADLDDRLGLVDALNGQAALAMDDGDHDAAVGLYRRALGILDLADAPWQRTQTLDGLGAALHRGEPAADTADTANTADTADTANTADPSGRSTEAAAN